MHDLFVELLDQFKQIIVLDNLAYEKLSVELRLPIPSTTTEWKKFYRKFKKTLRLHNAQTYLEDPVLRDLLPSFLEISSAMRETKLKIITRIVTLFPTLSKSEYIDPRDKAMLNFNID